MEFTNSDYDEECFNIDEIHSIENHAKSEASEDKKARDLNKFVMIKNKS